MRYCILFIFAIWVVYPLFAQNDGESSTISNGQLWNELSFTHAIKKFVLQADLEVNRSNDLNHKPNLAQHYLNIGARGFGHYYATPRIKLTAGFEYINATDVPEVNQVSSTELRQIFQAQHFIVRKRLTVFNRVRYENRFISRADQPYSYAARLRYMPKTFIALNSKVIRRKTLYLIASDEILWGSEQGRLLTSTGPQLASGIVLQMIL
jgi:hypothetical protein